MDEVFCAIAIWWGTGVLCWCGRTGGLESRRMPLSLSGLSCLCGPFTSLTSRVANPQQQAFQERKQELPVSLKMCIWHGVTPTTFYLLMQGTGLLVLKLGEDGCVSLGSMGPSLEVNFHCNKPHCFINSDSCCLSIQ